MQILDNVPILINDLFSLFPSNERCFIELPKPVHLEDDNDTNPLLEEDIKWRDSTPVLLPYQQRWLKDQSPIKLYEKSRRTGISWSSALEAVLVSSSQNGENTYYSSYNMDMCTQFIQDCEYWAKALNISVSPIEASLFEDDEDRSIFSFKIKFASGYQIKALSSKPTNFRSKQGFIIIDEAGFLPDPEGVIKSIIAMLMWGSRVAIISTHNGINSVFNQLITEAKNGDREISIHRTTLDDAIADGLYKRICRVTNKQWSLDAELAWRLDIVKQYGIYADEELFCIPSTNSDRLFDDECVNNAFIGSWAEPEKDHYYMGALDPAFGGEDNFVFGVFDITTKPMRLVAEYSTNFGSTKNNRKQVHDLIKKYKVYYLAIEQNGGGNVIAEAIQDENKKITIEAVRTSHMSKLIQTDDLAVGMSDGDIIFPSDWKGKSEFESFSKKLREAMIGKDDRVMMVAIARAHLQEAIDLKPKKSRPIAADDTLQRFGT